MGKQKLEPSDTVDAATHLLHRLQADGWTVKNVEQDYDYGTTRPGGRKLLISQTITIELVPIR